MYSNLWNKFDAVTSSPIRATAVLGLMLIATIMGSAHADDVEFGFAAGMGGTAGYDEGFGITVDALGNVYTAGQFGGTADFDPGMDEENLISAGLQDIFVSKLDSDGNLVWARAMGGTGEDYAESIAVDALGNVYTTGHFEGTADFDPGVGTEDLVSNGGADVFISKLDSDGNYVWARAMGGFGEDWGIGIAVDPSGNVHTGGFFESVADFDPGMDLEMVFSAGLQDIFISKLDSDGNYVWARTMGGTQGDFGVRVAVDSSGNVYSAGIFEGTGDFDPGVVGTDILTSAGLQDIFISKLDSDGNHIWARRMGGTGNDQGEGISVDSSGNVYTTGQFEGTADFDPGMVTEDLMSAGSGDIFVSKLDSDGNFVWATATGGPLEDDSNNLTLDAVGNVYTTGWFQGTADFDPGMDEGNLISAGGIDMFISKLDSGGNFVWAKSIGGSFVQQGFGIAVGVSGDVYTTGNFEGTADFDPGMGTEFLVSAGSADHFVSKLVVTQSAIVWADFGFAGSEDGSESNPFNTFWEGLVHATSGGMLLIKGDTGNSVSNETIRFDQPVTIQAINGSVRIGESGVR